MRERPDAGRVDQRADTDGAAGIQDHLQKMGQPLFGWPMPNGYPTDAKSWTGGLIPRWN